MTIVSTSYGRLRGARDGATVSFKGIPFAKPPLGALRFRGPQPPEAWDGLREATTYGSSALQAESPVSKALAMEVGPVDEDCLYLNVWTPSPEGRRPVMVWIHGGAFVIGSGSQELYNGSGLAARGDVVVVTLNYRLGAFGFLRLPAIGATGNEAIMDQEAALRWVRDEIPAFGGDPGNVTVFGESAGSISITALLAAPTARNLFHRVILQSGSANLLSAPEAAEGIGTQILEHLGLRAEDAAKLRDVSAADLQAAQNAATPRSAGVSYAPVIDGTYIPRSTFEAAADGELAHLAIMAGTTQDELKLFAFMDPGAFQLDEAGLLARADGLTGGNGARAIVTYRAARTARGEAITPFETYEAIATDAAMRMPTLRLLEAQRPHNPAVYSFLFTHPSPSLGGMLGACHATDLPFVFGTYEIEAMKTFVGEGPEVAALSSRVQDAWLAFARSGTPSREGLPAWHPYDPTARVTAILGPGGPFASAPREPERAFWQSLAP